MTTQPLHPSLIHTCTSRLFLMKPSLALPGTGGYSPRVADCQCWRASHAACSAGTTTSEVTVPIVLAIGLGIGKAINVQVWPVSAFCLRCRAFLSFRDDPFARNRTEMRFGLFFLHFLGIGG